MRARAIAQLDALNIAAVERDTGLSKDTLRVWERRYGFPAPARDAAGRRVYRAADVEKLRLLKQLIERGERMQALAGLELRELQALRDRLAPETARDAAPEASGLIELLKAHDLDGLRRRLYEWRSRVGAGRFVSEVVAAFVTQIGDAWMHGQLQVYEEHLGTELIESLLRETIATLPPVRMDARPRVLLSTLPGEPHGLGLLMAETMFALDGARCLSLGVATPVWDIVLAARGLDCDIVALGFTGCMNPNQVVDALTELRERLPAAAALWAGGAAPVLHRRPVAGATAIATLSQLGPELRRWRAARMAGRRT